MTSKARWSIASSVFACWSLLLASSADGQDNDVKPRIGFAGLHGGVFETLEPFARPLGLEIQYIRDQEIADASIDLGKFDLILFQHTRSEYTEQYERLIENALQRNPSLNILSVSGYAEDDMPNLAKAGSIRFDPKLSAYYGNTSENLRRMLIYLGVEYLGMEGQVVAPDQTVPSGLFHPDHSDLFENCEQFLSWYREHKGPTEDRARAIVTVHATHLTFQQPRVVTALVRELEKQGAVAVALTDGDDQYEQRVADFQPTVVIHTCHSRDSLAQREQWGVPHTSSIFFREQPIADWQVSIEGLTSSEMTFQIVGQELIGTIEPQVGAGTQRGGGSEEAFTPIHDRIAHLVSRSLRWAELSTKNHADKKVAFIYYDREMGKAELMRGSATGMFMNAPRSMVRILRAMREDGYKVGRVPDSEDELLAWMMEYGRQIGVWAPGVLDRLARSGQAVLIPTETYESWFEQRVPADLRSDVIEKWGEAPGEFLVWENQGKSYIVIPRIDLGNVTLLPQPLRGEAQDTSLVHDLRVPPPHNYLATYFWLDAEFGADAMIHFGTHGSEFLLPGKPTGLSSHDWPDIVMGRIPNINPWVINNLGESSPVKRRAYAVLVDHLVPPSVNAELSDELQNLHADIDKWIVLEDGALKERFRESITRQVRDEGLLIDCHLRLGEGELLSGKQVKRVLAYLHDIHNDTTPTSLHVFGEPPRDDLLIPYLATCLGDDFRKQLNEVIEVPAGEALTPGDAEKYLRLRSEEILGLIVRQGFNASDAIASVGGSLPPEGFSKQLTRSLARIEQLVDGFRQTPQELSQLLAALDGKFIAAGPGNSPDRNPAVLPTGRNMVVMNPEEVPTRPSWEVGQELVDGLLESQFKKDGRYPEKIAFTLNSFATFQDYGVMESQILYLMGVKPVWNEKNQVSDLELIPSEELGRPRIDVFIAGLSYYRDMLPTRMRLLDRAVRLVAESSEAVDTNYVRRNSELVYKSLLEQGVPEERAKRQATARIFGYPLGQQGSAGYYYLVEKSGHWDTREDLMETYLSHVRNVYTEGAWGEPAANAYNEQIQGTEIVLRTWSDRTRSPLSNKYDWYHGGSLAQAVKHLTGNEPQFLLSDVRDPNRARMVSAEDALRQDFRVRLFNRKWIEGMMKEGYAGADQVAVHVGNARGWTIMRPGSVADDFWMEIVDTYIRDRKNLNIQEWFESENPFAYQEMNEILLETIRKGYWQPDSETIREIATEYVKSVVRHGEGGGLRGGGNEKRESFVNRVLSETDDGNVQKLLADYDARSLEQVSGALPSNQQVVEPQPTASAPPVESEGRGPEQVTGNRLEPVEQSTPETPTRPSDRPVTDSADEPPWQWIALAVIAAVLMVGFKLRWGASRR